MGDRTGIEWTDATWNPVTGCTRVSAGCDHCYAASLAERRLREIYLRRAPAVESAQNRADPFAVRLWPERLEQPAKWVDPRIVFVNSMSDLFHSDIPDAYVQRVFGVMLAVDRHVYQVLTKRPSRALRFWRRHADLFGHQPVPEHIWIGTSIENQDVVYRVDHLRQVPAAVRFLSCEPLLGPLALELTGVHWVIAGGESGPNYRSLDLAWARGIRDQCHTARIPFFFKQVGGRTPKASGRELDGVTWDEMPSIGPAAAVTA